MRIELPSSDGTPESPGLPYPQRIALSALMYLQAVIFLYSVHDAAAGEIPKDPSLYARVESLMDSHEQGTWASGWGFVSGFDDVLSSLVMQDALIACLSQWDWYIRRLGAWVAFAESSRPASMASADDMRQLGRVDQHPIGSQLELLERVSGAAFDFDGAHLGALREMTAVRNIGIHNRWECDEKYLSSTAQTGLNVGDLRMFDGAELQGWHSVLQETISRVSLLLANRYESAPAFPG